MPEGQAIHRIARLINERFEGADVVASSPQGRFSDGARRLDGLTAGRAEAWGKHFFMPFADGGSFARADNGPSSGMPAGSALQSEEESSSGRLNAKNAIAPGAEHLAETPLGGTSLGDDGPLWLHIHLGLYGRWHFTGEGSDAIVGAGVRSGNHNAVNVGAGSTVRLRLAANGFTADLTGPSRCEILDGPGVRAAVSKLGPDPVRNEPGDRERFVEAVRRRRSPVGQLVLDQSIAAGPGNIYRADCLFRVGISPLRPGNKVSAERLKALWDDLVETMQADVPDGVIRTVPESLRPEPAKASGAKNPDAESADGDDPEAQRFAVYHRTGRPCLRCGTPVAEKEMAGRRLFWCPSCQR
ncbi:hypothetical protein A4H34_01360 [Peptidiphaga gingivicola]|uniref:DNA-(apurinic or apyrimidinic site) lyase n=1 Tax=Peptidiphaga gingivicola TaxID=2741497 RepID=A0A179B321_9ACTO|nr:zinc finger domain-containing protein [Peptidiphaga gingivicola]OAP85870.1 hypothetical protein A4H34_01360 [Peptidiphaga gingivicola]